MLTRNAQESSSREAAGVVCSSLSFVELAGAEDRGPNAALRGPNAVVRSAETVRQVSLTYI